MLAKPNMMVNTTAEVDRGELTSSLRELEMPETQARFQPRGRWMGAVLEWTLNVVSGFSVLLRGSLRIEQSG